MQTIYRGDSIRFTLTSEDTDFNSFEDYKLYLYNSINSYEIIRGEEWYLKEDANCIVVSIQPDRTKDMVVGDYNFVIKGKIHDNLTDTEYMQSAKVMNIIRLEDSPARHDFIDKVEDNNCNNCNCNGEKD